MKNAQKTFIYTVAYNANKSYKPTTIKRFIAEDIEELTRILFSTYGSAYKDCKILSVKTQDDKIAYLCK